MQLSIMPRKIHENKSIHYCHSGVQAVSEEYESERSITHNARQVIADLEASLADSKRLLAAEASAKNNSKNALARKYMVLPCLAQ